MRIDGAIPPHVARAYGISPTRSAVPAPAPAAPATPARLVDARVTNERIQMLVAGRVPGGVHFDGAADQTAASGAAAQARTAGVPTSAPGAMALYTRAADRVEAALGVALGRTVDIRG